jgi:hypothetical protein
MSNEPRERISGSTRPVRHLHLDFQTQPVTVRLALAFLLAFLLAVVSSCSREKTVGEPGEGDILSAREDAANRFATSQKPNGR